MPTISRRDLTQHRRCEVLSPVFVMANNQSENVKILFYNLTTFSINERDSICHFKFNLKEKLFLNNDFQHISSFHHFFGVKSILF